MRRTFTLEAACLLASLALSFVLLSVAAGFQVSAAMREVAVPFIGVGVTGGTLLYAALRIPVRRLATIRS